jgi:hypothetical protein
VGRVGPEGVAMRRLVTSLFLLVLCVVPTRSEVSVNPHGERPNLIIFGSITDDPNPLGLWSALRPVPDEGILNSDGDQRGDGRPDTAIDPTTGNPVVVWAYNLGTDYEIALARWTGSEWGSPRFLSAGPENDLDPRLFIRPGGFVHVVWWQDGPTPEVVLMNGMLGLDPWGPPITVTAGGETGRRPSVAVFDDKLHVAFERDSTVAGMAQDVVVAQQQTNGTFAFQVVASTTRSGPLDVVFHVGDDTVWLDWKQSDNEMGWAELEASGWTSPDPQTWPDDSWIGTEDTRALIRAMAAAP